MARWALKLQEFDIEIGYRPGNKNQNADCLSRNPVFTISFIEFDSTWAADQESDIHCNKIIKSLKDGNKEIIKKYHVNQLGILTTHDGRLVVPTTKRHKVLQLNHDQMLAGHLGISRTHTRLKRQYKWLKMREDVVRYVNGCLKTKTLRSHHYGTTDFH